jgi:hypothetical protein
MKLIMQLAVTITLALSFSSCGAGRSDYSPQGGQPTVGMPAKLSDRERSFAPELESALSRSGYMPVRHGAGDLELTFRITEGPINTDTTIELLEEERQVARGFGRAAGAPLIGRRGIAEKSFQRAFSEFESSLPNGASAMDPSPGTMTSADEAEYVY